jgi:hypothetical protein
LVLGQVCVRESQLKTVGSDIEFSLKLSLPKDPRGLVRRDIQEEKEKQVGSLLCSKIKKCLDFEFRNSSMADSESLKPLEVLMSVNVIQDSQTDGNLLCALSSVCNDLLLQLHSFNQNLVSNLFWSTICLKTQTKVVIDPSSIQEASLSNNLVMVTGVAKLNSLTQPKIQIEKGANILRTNYGGAQP